MTRVVHGFPRVCMSAARAALTAVALSCASAIGATAHAGDASPPFLSVPRVSVQDPARFRDLLEGSRSDVVRIAMFGDSQETSPNGWGTHYVAYLNARFARVFGPAGESILATNLYALSPPNWLATSVPSSAQVPTTVPASAVPPGVVVHRILPDAGGPTGASRTVFLQDAARAVGADLVGGPWFDQAGPYVAELLVAAGGTTSPVRWTNAPTDADVVDVTAPVVQAGLASAPAKAPPGTFHWIATPPLDLAGKRHLQISLSGAPKGSGAEVAGLRFRSLAHHRGITVQPFARGGMRLAHIEEEHADSGPFLRTFDASMVVLHYGANDPGAVFSVEVWRSQVLSTISWLRTQLKRPDLPVVLASDLRCACPGAFWLQDQMPVVAHEIAMTDANVLALNLPRIVTEEYMWLDRRPYLYDSAHLRPHAQRMLAEAFVGELCAALSIPDPGCDQAHWADCVRTLGSTCEYGGCVLVTDVDAEVLALDWNGPGTDCADVDGDGYPELCPPPASPDINGDGAVDAADLGILLGAWGERYPPADLDFDGEVGAADLSILLARWGE